MYDGRVVKKGKVQKEEKRFKVAVILCIYNHLQHYLATPTAEGKGDGTLSPFDLAVE